ncbi:MAG: tetraacyldisaccharide 4'-kinase [Planctomycetota bacterium]|nr:tetraacyldisaccharide 4'-kinase [Planctomycetota bacterium]MDA1113795.1 tetraacyldisaccharide 4'-kinase [Planctomycetota bacterium]
MSGIAARLDGPLGALLAPFGWVFSHLAAARVSAFERGWKASVKPPRPTMSIGNISAGGTGKTPLLFHALEWFAKHDARIGVLSRGYGGDEGRMLEERFPEVLLAEGADRIAGMRTLMQAEEPPEMFLLDDGFQHLKLKRDIDIVVLDALRPFGRCFPAGIFRESVHALKRADLIVMSRAEFVPEEERLAIWKKVQQVRGPECPLPRVEGGVVARDLRNLKDGRVIPVREMSGQEVRLAAGIGNHDSFFRLVQAKGLKVERFARLADHYAWSASDVAQFGSDLPLIVTEKDGVKLRPFAEEHCWELRVDWDFRLGAEAWEQCLAELHLPIRAARIEPLWAAHDPDGRGGV